MEHSAANIMSTSIYSLTPTATLADAMKMSREHNIRHIPVVDSEKRLLGIVSQKSLFNKAMHMLTLYGTQESIEMEQATNIREVMESECMSISSKISVSELIPMFKNNRHGCLPVVDQEEHLLGIVTSSSFVDYCGVLLLSE